MYKYVHLGFWLAHISHTGSNIQKGNNERGSHFQCRSINSKKNKKKLALVLSREFFQEQDKHSMTQIIIWSLGHFAHNQYSSKWTWMGRKWIPQVTGQQEQGTGWQASWKAAEKVSRTAIWTTPSVVYKSKLWDTYSVRNFQLWKQFVVIPVSLFLPSHQGCVQACRLPLTKQIQLYHLPRM